MPFAKSDAISKRHDSVFDTALMNYVSNRTRVLYWYTIFVGATDRKYTVQAAEYLLGHVWPEIDANATLETVGNPAKILAENENNELWERLSSLLLPEHNALG